MLLVHDQSHIKSNAKDEAQINEKERQAKEVEKGNQEIPQEIIERRQERYEVSQHCHLLSCEESMQS